MKEEKDTEILVNLLDSLYKTKETWKLKELFKEAVGSLNSLMSRDDMDLTIFHYFCIAADKLEKDPEVMESLLEILLNSSKGVDKEKADSGFFCVFNRNPVRKIPKSLNDWMKKASLTSPDPFGEPLLNYLAKRRLYKSIRIILKGISDCGQQSKVDVNRTENNQESFIEQILADNRPIEAYEILSQLGGKYVFELDNKNERKLTIRAKLTESISREIHKSIEKNDIESLQKIFDISEGAKDLLSLAEIFSYSHMGMNILHYVAESSSLEILELLLSSSRIIKEEALSTMLNQVENFKGLTLLLYSCSCCPYQQTHLLLSKCGEKQINSLSKAGNTCLHLLALNRRMNIEQKKLLVIEILEQSPSLASKMNSEGHLPLTLWMCALAQYQENIHANEIISFIANLTDMSVYKDQTLLAEMNIKKLEELKNRKENSKFFKKFRRRDFLKNKFGPPKKTKEYFMKKLTWSQEIYQEKKKVSLISPVETAIQCRRKDWLEVALDRWGLTGNVITNEGRHILDLAISCCPSEMVKYLIEKGQLERRIQDPKGTFVFHLDGVITIRMLFAYLDLYAYLNLRKTVDDDSVYTDYVKKIEEWIEVNGKCTYCERNKDYYLDFVKSTEERSEFESICRDVINSLEEIAGTYISTLGTLSPLMQPASLKETTNYVPENLIFPFNPLNNILKLSCTFPELSKFSIKLLEDVEKEMPEAAKKIRKKIFFFSLSHGNIKMTNWFTEVYSDFVKEIIKEKTIPKQLFCRYIYSGKCNISDLFHILKQYYDVSNFSNEKMSLYNKRDRMNLWTSKLQVNHRIQEFLYALAKEQTATPESALLNLKKNISLYEKYDSIYIYLFPMAFGSSPDLTRATKEELKIIQSNIFILQKFGCKFIQSRFLNFGYALMKYINAIMISFLKRSIENLGCKYEFGSEDFKFYFAHCRKYMKSSLFSNEGYWLNALFSKEDIEGFKFYFRTVEQWHHKIQRMSYCIDAKIPFMWFYDKAVSSFKKGVNAPSYTLATSLQDNEGCEMIQNFLECPLMSPIFDYIIVANNYKRRRIKKKNAIYLTAEWNNFPASRSIAEHSSVFNGKLLSKLMEYNYCDNNKEVEEIIRLALDKLQSFCKDPNKVKVLKGIYEYEFANICENIEGEDLEKLLSAKIPTSISNPMVYGLFDAGLDDQTKIREYFLVELIQKASPEFCHSIVEKYSLPLNVLSFQMYVEPRDYNFKKNCYKRRLCRIKPKGIRIPKIRGRRMPKYVTSLLPIPDMSKKILYKFTCPILTLCKLYTKEKRSLFNQEAEITALSTEQKQTLYEEFLQVSAAAMTAPLFEELLAIRKDRKLLTLPQYKLNDFYAFLITLSTDKFLHALQKLYNESPAALEFAMVKMVNLAAENRHTQVVLTLAAFKAYYFIRKKYVVPCSLEFATDHFLSLYRMSFEKLCLTLLGSPSLNSLLYAIDILFQTDLSTSKSKFKTLHCPYIAFAHFSSDPEIRLRAASLLNNSGIKKRDNLSSIVIIKLMELIDSIKEFGFPKIPNVYLPLLSLCPEFKSLNRNNYYINKHPHYNANYYHTSLKMESYCFEVQEDLENYSDFDLKEKLKTPKLCEKTRKDILKMLKSSSSRISRNFSIFSVDLNNDPRQMPDMTSLLPEIANLCCSYLSNVSSNYQLKLLQCVVKINSPLLASVEEKLLQNVNSELSPEILAPLLNYYATFPKGEPIYTEKIMEKCSNCQVIFNKLFKPTLRLKLDKIFYLKSLKNAAQDSESNKGVVNKFINLYYHKCGKSEEIMNLISNIGITKKKPSKAPVASHEENILPISVNLATFEKLLGEMLRIKSLSEILGSQDSKGNNLFHKIAMYNRRDILLLLEKMNLITVTDMSNYSVALKKKNCDNLSPFVVAIAFNNLDIAQVFTLPDVDIKELSAEEKQILLRSGLPSNAIYQVFDDYAFETQGQLWKRLFPEREKLKELALRYGSNENLSVKNSRRIPNFNQDTSITTQLQKYLINGNIFYFLSYLVFRPDIFVIFGTAPSEESSSISLYKGLYRIPAMLPFARILQKIGFTINSKSDFKEIFHDFTSRFEDRYLLSMQIFDIIKNHSEEAYNNLLNEPEDSLYLSPYFYFKKTDCYKIGSESKFVEEDFDFLIKKIQKPFKPPITGIDLVELAVQFATSFCFKSFIAILMYAHKFDYACFQKILSKVEANVVLSLILTDNSQYFPWLFSIMPEKLGLVIDLKEKTICSQENGQPLYVKTSGSISGVLYSLLHYGQKGVKLTKEGKELDISSNFQKGIKFIAKHLVNVYGLYWKESKNSTVSRPAVSLNDTIRNLRLFGSIVHDMIELDSNAPRIGESAISKVPLLISESEIAMYIIRALTPDKSTFFTGRWFLNLKTSAEELLSAAEKISYAKKISLPEAACKLFTEEFIYGIEEVGHTLSHYYLNVTVHFGESTMFRILNKTDGVIPVVANWVSMNSKKLMQQNPISGIQLEMEYIIGLEDMEAVEKQKEAMNIQISEELLSMQLDRCEIQKIGTPSSTQQFKFDNNSFKSLIRDLNKQKSVFTSSSIMESATKAISRLLINMESMFTSLKKLIIPPSALEVHNEENKKILCRKVYRNKVELYKVHLAQEIDSTPSKDLLRKSIDFATTPGEEQKESTNLCNSIFYCWRFQFLYQNMQYESH